MDREKLLDGLGDLKGLIAVEIGALDKPILTSDETHVVYVDYTDTETLKRNYASFPDHDINKIVEVGAVWGDKTLSEALGEGFEADVVLASHVLEHVPDIITWLGEICSILKQDGSIRLVIPDRRYCFDVRRRDSTSAEVIYSYMMQARTPLPHQILDFGMNFLAVDSNKIWDGTENIPTTIDREQINHGIMVAQAVIKSGEYFDIHCWTFTPLSFSRLMYQLVSAEFVNLYCKYWHDTERYDLEFCVVMNKGDDKERSMASWQAMAEMIEDQTRP